jgi:hypothetical protein
MSAKQFLIFLIYLVPLLAICAVIADLHPAADRLQPAGRPDLRPVRDLVRGGEDGDLGGVLGVLT